MALLEVEQLTVHYGKIIGVENISFKIEEGEIIAIIGSNGAGKSTTLNALVGLTPKTSGSVRFLGERIDKDSPEKIVRKGLCLIPEGKRLWQYMTVLETLKMGAYIRKDKKEIQKDIEQIMERFPSLKARQRIQAGRLSGGEQQMLAIARGLMTNPKLLVLDEPSVGLGPLVIDELFNVLSDINKKGVAIVLVEQNASATLEFACRAYVIETGRIVLQGDCKELINDERVKKAYLGG